MTKNAFVRLAAVCLSLCWSSLVFASPTNTQGTLGKVNVNGTGQVRVNFVANTAMCSSGGSGGPTSIGEIVLAGANLEGAKAILSTLLAAKLAGRSVEIWADNGAPGTYGCSIIAVTIL